MFAQSNGLALETRDKWPIPNDLRPERPKISLETAITLMAEQFPDARFRSITNTYNCVGMVVAARRVWAYPEDLVKVLEDDGYRKLIGPQEADKGDVIIYHDEDGEPAHVGIVIQKEVVVGANDDNIVVLSKWGGDGEYIHKSRHVPSVYGNPAEFWSHRRRP